VKRATWREDVQQVPAATLVFVDESGSHTSMTPLYGWAPKNERAYGVTPRKRGQNTTILGALSPHGVQAAMTLAGAADTIAFEVFIEQVLVPTLQPGQTVVMDNLSIHKSQTTRQLIENCGCTLLFLPAYSPDFSPIEPGAPWADGASSRHTCGGWEHAPARLWKKPSEMVSNSLRPRMHKVGSNTVATHVEAQYHC